MLSTDRERLPRTGLLSAIIVTMAICLCGALTGLIRDRNSGLISEYFLVVQDAPVLLLVFVFLGAVVLSFRRDKAVAPGAPIQRQRATHLVWASLALALTVIVGACFTNLNFPLSMDEFWVEFDATIITHGRLLASVTPEWRDYVPALQPIFRLAVPENAYWISNYLPMNAAIRAMFAAIGEPTLAGACLAGTAIVALAGIARRLWPDRPDAAVIAVILLATSPQFLITAMTPYAMTAHLALNLVWLWLFLRGTRICHGLAAGVAFVACGLHQVVFHPLFVAPFIISLWFGRRWKLALYYSLAYAIIGLFWVSYWSLILKAASPQIGQSADVGLSFLIQRISEFVRVDPAGIGLMGLNLYRFVAWQNPILIPLAIVGFIACRKWSSPLFHLAAGIVLTLVVVTVLMPFQGHGWGYRYLHGFLGSFALLAAQGWVRLTDRNAPSTERLGMAMLFSIILSVFVLLPWHAYQANAFVRPYASAVEAIHKSQTDVVVVDPADVWYGLDLVRNDPFLRTAPKVLGLNALHESQLKELCRRYNVAIFDRRDARRFGIRDVPSGVEVSRQTQRNREAMVSLNCGRAL